MQINIHQAKTHLSKLLEKVADGEEVIIAKAGKPVAKIIRILDPVPKRKLGVAKGQYWMADDFNDPLPDFERLFYGESKKVKSK